VSLISFSRYVLLLVSWFYFFVWRLHARNKRTNVLTAFTDWFK
jgi:hypothetical protein